MRILQSTIESMLYMLLLLVFAGLLVVGIVAHNVTTKINQQQQEINQATQNIEKQNICLVSLFLQPNRANLTLADLNTCTTVVKEVPK